MFCFQIATAVQQNYAFGVNVPEHNKMNSGKEAGNSGVNDGRILFSSTLTFIFCLSSFFGN